MSIICILLLFSQVGSGELEFDFYEWQNIPCMPNRAERDERAVAGVAPKSNIITWPWQITSEGRKYGDRTAQATSRMVEGELSWEIPAARFPPTL
jgi:hypothetical protein